MLRLNLLRDLQAEDQAAPAPARSGLPRRLAAALLVLLAVGAILLFVAQPRWLRLDASRLPALFTGVDAKAVEAARADSLRRLEVLRAEASRRVAVNQSLAAAWLEQLETVLPASGEPVFSLASFTPPGEFLLRGTAPSEEAISVLQEALVLFPGMDLRQSEIGEAGTDGKPGLPFAFSGSVALAGEDSLPASDRILSLARLDAEIEEMRRSALSAGITLAPPEAAKTGGSGALRMHLFRVSGSCDSTGFSAVLTFVEQERQRKSPFGIQRVILTQRDSQKLVFLDIMTFSL